MLAKSLHPMDLSNIYIVSDRQKGLCAAIQSRYLPENHYYCCRHIAKNIAGKFKDKSIIAQFWCAAKAYRRSEYDDHIAIICKILVDAYNYVPDINRERWANTFVIGSRYDMLKTNLAESTNNLLKEIREYQAICQQAYTIL